MYNIPVNDFEEWRKEARELIKRRIEPQQVTWQEANQQALLLGNDDCYLMHDIQIQSPAIPRDFLHLAKKVSFYRDEERWSLLYSVAWRLVFETRDLLSCKIDSQVARLFAMQKAVGRDKHKMEAFVRFRLLSSSKKSSEEYFISWFEPEHLIVPLVTPFFVKRFTAMTWSILTPDACVHWDRNQAILTGGVTKPKTIEDPSENLWLEYYANIFNPARLKLKAMQSEMPKKYWINLPEAKIIADLTREANQKTQSMIEKPASQPWIKTKKSRFVCHEQKRLREKNN